MNTALTKALNELKSAGAKGLPAPPQVLAAKNGKSWTGKKSNGDNWQLQKNDSESFNCMC